MVSRKQDFDVSKALRRTLLYVPGNNPAVLQDCIIYGCDCVVLDLEDAISIDEKDAARHLVAAALEQIDFEETLVSIRVNGTDTEYFDEDIEAIVPLKPDFIRIPKINCKEDVHYIDQRLSEVEKKHDLPIGTTKIEPMLETAKGIRNAFEIAEASPRVFSMSVGGEDLTADLGIKRTNTEEEMMFARSRVVFAAKAAGIHAIDTIFGDINDEEGLLRSSRNAYMMGFSGKALINPRQVEGIHKGFMPDVEDLEKAKRIVDAFNEAQRKGLGVVAVNGRMVDAPVVKRSLDLLKLAKSYGMVK